MLAKQIIPGKRAVLMLSGGLDSIVQAYDLHANNIDTVAVYFTSDQNIGKKSQKVSQETCERLGIPFKLVALDAVADMVSEFPAAKYFVADDGGGDGDSGGTDSGGGDTRTGGGGDSGTGWETSAIPSAFLMYSSITAYFAQASSRSVIYFGMIKEQADRSLGLVSLLTNFPALLHQHTPEAGQVQMSAPYADLTKAEVISRGQQLGVPLGDTWSCCHTKAELQCGQCFTCKERRASFTVAGVPDPTIYAS